MSTYKDINDEFRFNVKFFMDFRDLTQADLARKLDVSRTQVGRILNGTSSPTLDTVANLANALEVPPHFLVRMINDFNEGEDIETALAALIQFKLAKNLRRDFDGE